MHATDAAPRTVLEDVLRTALLLGVALVLLIPSVRDTQTAVGWLPMWLVAMPAVALWALRGFAMPQPAPRAERVRSTRRAMALPQARRRARRVTREAAQRMA